MKTLKIDDELRRWMPPAAAISDEELEKSLLEEGCRDPIVVWKEEDVIVDGHRRYEFCQKNNIRFDIEMMSFPNKEAAKAWMDRTAIARRNLNDRDFAAAVDRQIARLRAAGMGKQESVEEVAGQAGVSERQVHRIKREADALRSLPEETADRIRRGEIRASKEAIVALAKLGEIEQKYAIQEWDTGDYKTLGDILNNFQEEEDGQAEEPAPTTDAASPRPTDQGKKKGKQDKPKSDSQALKELANKGRLNANKVLQAANRMSQVKRSGILKSIEEKVRELDELLRKWAGIK